MQTRSPFTALYGDSMNSTGSEAVRQGQATITAVVVIVSVVERLLVDRYASVPVFLTGLALVLVAQVLAFVVPWDRGPRWTVAVLPLVSIVAAGLMELAGPTISTMGLVTVVPAVWLGITFRWPGVVAATATAAVVTVVPVVLRLGPSSDGPVGFQLVLPIAVFVISNSVCMVQDLRDDQERELRATSAELEQTAAAVKDGADLLNTVFEVLDTGVLVLDEHGQFATMNPALRRMRQRFGAEAKAVDDPWDHLFESDRTTRIAHDDRPTAAANRGESFSDRLVWYGEDPRRQLAASVSARPIVGLGGEHRGAVMVYHDVTDLVVALQAKDEFVASVSHELRTPLTSIIGYLELLEEDDEMPGRLRRHLDIVGRNADRLLSLVTDLLTVAQAEAGQMRFAPVETDLGEVVARAMDSARVRADARGLSLHTDLEPLAPMTLDPGRIAQVIDNLVSNAIKYTPEGGSVTARLRPDDDDAVLEVVDTGIGISADDQMELFTKFFRAREVERQAIPGVGLGLVISRAIVLGHDGRIAITSTPGAGTTVTVRLPR